ncbi:MAG: twin-arginine translocase TatA/TatE family subunit [Syntrophomonadaceae bacterium]
MFGFIGNIGPWELVLVLLIALIVFGPGKLPEVAKGLGKAVNQFKNASSGIQKEFQDALKDEPPVEPAKTVATDPAVAKAVSTGDPEIIKTAGSTEPEAAKESKEERAEEPKTEKLN